MRKIFLLSAVILSVIAVTSGHSVLYGLGDEGVENIDKSELVTRHQLEIALQSLVPCGTVVMWYFDTASIPHGWAICNGESGTPDLRDRFIVNAGSIYDIGDIGGMARVGLNLHQMPKHVHITSWPATPITSIQGTSPNTQFLIPTCEIDTQAGLGAWSGAKDTDLTTVASISGPATAPSSENDDAELACIGKPHENLPPYYALSFIMKLCKEHE